MLYISLPTGALGRARPRPSDTELRRAARAGFTLMEIIVALVMVAVVYAIALPSIRGTRVSASVHNARHVVVSTISLARATAMRFGRPAVLHLDSEAEELWVEVDTTLAGTGATSARLGFFSLGDDLDVDLESDRSALCFNGRGIATTGASCPEAGAVIVLSLKDEADTVTVNAVGRVLP